MKWISAQEVIALHDRILCVLPGVPGMPDAGRAEALISRVHNRMYYEGVEDVFELAATYWIAIARGHIFNDGNKRTSIFITVAFLMRNGYLIRDDDTSLEEMTVQVAMGKHTPEELAVFLKNRIEN